MTDTWWSHGNPFGNPSAHGSDACVPACLRHRARDNSQGRGVAPPAPGFLKGTQMVTLGPTFFLALTFPPDFFDFFFMSQNRKLTETLREEYIEYPMYLSSRFTDS